MFDVAFTVLIRRKGTTTTTNTAMYSMCLSGKYFTEQLGK